MMHSYLHYIFCLSFILPTAAPIKSSKHSELLEKSKLFNDLNRELRNAICCVNKMKCCKRSTNEEHIEIRAILIRCPNTPCSDDIVSRRFDKPISSAREGVLKQFQGFDEDELITQATLTNCRKKLLLTVKISTQQCDLSKNEYIVVDHVYDPVTKKNTRLLTPYVIKMKQEPVTQMYGLKFLHVVNSLAYEEILNKHSSNFTGCNTSPYAATCGRITYKGKVIPYSQGFCCSCDAMKNTLRQPESINQYSETLISYSDPAYLLDGVECPRNLKGNENINQAKDLLDNLQQGDTRHQPCGKVNCKQKNKYFSIVNTTIMDNTSQDAQKAAKQARKIRKPAKNDKSDHYFGDLSNIIKGVQDLNKLKGKTAGQKRLHKRQVLSSGVQRRGGQNCADRYTPKGFDPNNYHESAHCLRFSDLWYTVYRLHKPILEHSILIQIFEKYEDINGRVMWRDLTRGKTARVGTINRQFVDEKRTIAIKYESNQPSVDDSTFSINYKTALILVPEGTQKIKIKDYPELRAGPPEYLIIHPSQISMEGDLCNVAGVGFEAFSRQPNRCSRPKGTCLGNQPHHLWKHDHEAEKLHKKGCFFLKHYGKLASHPIRRNPTDGEQFLVLEYPGKFSSLIDVEIKADFNTILRPQSAGKITEVYVDSTSAYKTVLTVKVTNSGLTSSSFIARLSDCPLEMPASFSNIESRPALIPPQHQHTFNLEIKCPLPADRFHCSIEALNSKRELVALRRIRLQKYDRCICMWHCLCACVGSSEGLQCVPMSLQHYHAAGFQGSLPVTTFLEHYTFLDDALSLIAYILISLVFVLLVCGLFKAMIGILCSPKVGQWGLDIILDLPRPMKRYYEKQLTSHKKVYYDKKGWPVHPETKKRTRVMSRSTEICLNILFFFVFPLFVFLARMRNILCIESGAKMASTHSDHSLCVGTERYDLPLDSNITCACGDPRKDPEFFPDKKIITQIAYQDSFRFGADGISNQRISKRRTASSTTNKINDNELKAITEVSEYSSTTSNTSETSASTTNAELVNAESNTNDESSDWSDSSDTAT